MCIGIIAVFFITNWLIVFPQIVVRIYRKIKQCWHKKTKEEIEQENKIKSIIILPSARLGNAYFIKFIGTQSQNRSVLNTINTMRRNENIENEWKDVIIERVKGPNYHQHVEFMRRMEEAKKRREELQRHKRRQISEWAQF